MTAGRGVIHSELPEQTEGRMEGFQLWLNLPARDKMAPPWYRDIQSADVPEWRGPGVTARVIAGHSHGVAGAMQRDGTEPLYLDLHLEPGATFEQPLPAGHNAFVYVYRGALDIGAQPVPVQRMAILANAGDGVRLAAGPQPARALILVAGRPLRRADRPVRAVRDEHAGEQEIWRRGVARESLTRRRLRQCGLVGRAGPAIAGTIRGRHPGGTGRRR
jgi:redox-sensitive bicupin YhaK (pirin superfamily)